MADVLLYASIVLFVVYFVLFQRTFRALEPADVRRFTTDAALPMWRRILGMVPLLLLPFTSSFVLTLVLVAWLWAQLAMDTRAHHRKLEELEFAPGFRSRLRQVSYLAAIVLLLLSASVLLRRL